MKAGYYLAEQALDHSEHNDIVRQAAFRLHTVGGSRGDVCDLQVHDLICYVCRK